MAAGTPAPRSSGNATHSRGCEDELPMLQLHPRHCDEADARSVRPLSVREANELISCKPKGGNRSVVDKSQSHGVFLDTDSFVVQLVQPRTKVAYRFSEVFSATDSHSGRPLIFFVEAIDEEATLKCPVDPRFLVLEETMVNDKDAASRRCCSCFGSDLGTEHWVCSKTSRRLCPECRPANTSQKVWLLHVAGDGQAELQSAMKAMIKAGSIQRNMHEQYKVSNRPIGSGSSASVFRAHLRANRANRYSMKVRTGRMTSAASSNNDQDGGFVAKVLRPVSTEKLERQRQLLAKEVLTLAAVQGHPNVVGFAGFFLDAIRKGDKAFSEADDDAEDGGQTTSSPACGVSYIVVLDWCSGGDLWSLVEKNKGLTEARANDIIQGLLAGLDFVHRKGVVHRDVKPENTLLSAHGKPVITDFGMSCFASDSKECLKRVGSPGCAAPELISGIQYGTKVDVFSAGCVLFFMFCGRYPFWGSTTQSTLVRTVKGKLSFDQYANKFDAVSNNCKEFIGKLLQKKPDIRMSSTEALCALWRFDAASVSAPAPAPVSGAREEPSAEQSHSRESLADSNKQVSSRNLADSSSFFKSPIARVNVAGSSAWQGMFSIVSPCATQEGSMHAILTPRTVGGDSGDDNTAADALVSRVGATSSSRPLPRPPPSRGRTSMSWGPLARARQKQQLQRLLAQKEKRSDYPSESEKSDDGGGIGMGHARSAGEYQRCDDGRQGLSFGAGSGTPPQRPTPPHGFRCEAFTVPTAPPSADCRSAFGPPAQPPSLSGCGGEGESFGTNKFLDPSNLDGSESGFGPGPQGASSGCVVDSFGDDSALRDCSTTGVGTAGRSSGSSCDSFNARPTHPTSSQHGPHQPQPPQRNGLVGHRESETQLSDNEVGSSSASRYVVAHPHPPTNLPSEASNDISSQDCTFRKARGSYSDAAARTFRHYHRKLFKVRGTRDGVDETGSASEATDSVSPTYGGSERNASMTAGQRRNFARAGSAVHSDRAQADVAAAGVAQRAVERKMSR